MQHSPLRIASERDAELDPALRALVRELMAAREMALDLQVTVGEIVANLSAARSAALFRLQDLDRLAQTLGDLASFTGAVADATPSVRHFDRRLAARDLHLRELAMRLGGAPCVALPDEAGSEDDFLL